MFWPWQIVTNFLSLNFTYKLDFQCDENVILKEYNQWIKNNQLAKHPDIDNTGGWDVISLYSEDGKSLSVAKNSDKDTVPTEIIKDFPYTNSVIKDLLSKFNAKPSRIRFSTLRKGKKITWHRDWDESLDHGNCRLHIPITVNDKCYGNMCHQEYRWQPGELWYGDYSFPHQVVNLGDQDRLHIILDFKNPKNLFIDQNLFNQEEMKRKKYKKFIIFFYYFFYHYPKRLLSAKLNKKF
jgi:hypothetical protein